MMRNKVLGYGILILITVILVVYSVVSTERYHTIFTKKKDYQTELEQCGKKENGTVIVVKELRDVDVPKDSLYFHETSFMKGNKGINLNSRQACSIESAALAYPNKEIFVFILSEYGTDKYEINSDNFLVHLIAGLPNVNFRLINFQNFLKDTPLKRLNDRKVLKRSKFPTSHASDILRYATLYKFSGTYLDLDVIFMKPVNFINYVGLESVSSLGAAVINFGNDELGREMANTCAKEISLHFDGQVWGSNGPGVITRILMRKCRATSAENLLKANCHGFHILPFSSFYEISYTEYQVLLDGSKLNYFLRRIKKSYGVHMWNAFTSKEKIAVNNATVPYIYLAKKYCPQTYAVVKGDIN